MTARFVTRVRRVDPSAVGRTFGVSLVCGCHCKSTVSVVSTTR